MLLRMMLITLEIALLLLFIAASVVLALLRKGLDTNYEFAPGTKNPAQPCKTQYQATPSTAQLSDQTPDVVCQGARSPIRNAAFRGVSSAECGFGKIERTEEGSEFIASNRRHPVHLLDAVEFKTRFTKHPQVITSHSASETHPV